MSTPPEQKDAGDHPSEGPSEEPRPNGLDVEVKTLLALLSQLHDQTRALVEILGKIEQPADQPVTEPKPELPVPGSGEPSGE